MIALALSWPTWCPNRLSLQLARQGIEIAPSAVYRTLRRVGLGTRLQRLGVLEHRSAHRAGLLTERTRGRLQAARSSRATSKPPSPVSSSRTSAGQTPMRHWTA